MTADNADLDAKAAELMGWKLDDDDANPEWHIWIKPDGTYANFATEWSPTSDARDTERLMEFAWKKNLNFEIKFRNDIVKINIGVDIRRWSDRKDWKRIVTAAIVEALASEGNS